MQDLNSVLIEGNLTKDPEMAYLPTGTAKLGFSIGVNRSYRKDGEWKKEASFFDVVVWGKPAEYYNEKLSKGTRVRIIGRLKQDRWEKDGNTRSRICIVADNVDYWNRQGGSNGTE